MQLPEPGINRAHVAERRYYALFERGKPVGIYQAALACHIVKLLVLVGVAHIQRSIEFFKLFKGIFYERFKFFKRATVEILYQAHSIVALVDISAGDGRGLTEEIIAYGRELFATRVRKEQHFALFYIPDFLLIVIAEQPVVKNNYKHIEVYNFIRIIDYLFLGVEGSVFIDAVYVVQNFGNRRERFVERHAYFVCREQFGGKKD